MKNKETLETQQDYWDKISKDYRNRVITPFFNDTTTSAFFSALDEIRKGKGKAKNILDIGCGNGYLLPKLFLDENGQLDTRKNVVGIDFSSKMVKSVENYCLKHNLPAIIMMKDNNHLPFDDNYFDEVFSINSFLEDDMGRRFKAFCEAFRVLSEGGFMYGLFPSNENFLEQAYAIKEYHLRNGYNEASSIQKAYKELTKRRYDPIGGYIDFPDDGMRIKVYSDYEIIDVLENRGFKNIEIKKFKYPSSMSEELGLITGKNGIYDWLVCAEK